MKRLICLFTALLCIYSAFAQITTASLSGAITNQSQEKLVGATVILSHPTTGSEYAVVADVQGRYSLHGIRPSDGYILEVSYVGYESVRREGITLRVGDMHTEDIVLRPSTTLDAVVVTAEQVQSSQMTSKFDESLISQMPSVSRSLYDVVRLMPQAVATKSGGMSYGGVANRYNQFMINGMANNDMYGLSSSGTNGGLSNANPIALDAIEQLEVVVASYDVRMSGFGGGAINAITKSGTNEFKGSAYTYYNDHNFYGTTAGRNVAERKKLEHQSTQIYGATLGGAIIKNKLFFFLSGEFNHEASPSSYYLGYDGALLDGAELQRISDRYKALTGYDGGGVGRRNVEQRSGSLLATLDWHINSRNRLSASYSYLDARAEEYANSLSSFTFNGSGYANYSTAHYLALALESRLSDHTHNSLRIGYSRVGDGRKPDVGGDLPSVIIRNAGTTGGVAINIGNNRYAGINDLTQNVITLTDDLIMERGSHSITLGMHHEFYNIHNRYLANSYGTYTYNSVED
ncbi:MAG: TonB-dependent receptor, partial [Alistipes sp.]|nr:TonB-dependent receptor [Alistipes sp.]